MRTKANMAVVLVLGGAMGAAAQAQETQLFWGDTHLHTSFSPDAYFMENRTADPDTAYRFAKGLPVVHPYHRARIQIETPLDFLVVADHAEMMGVPYKLFLGEKSLTETPTGKRFTRMLEAGEGTKVFLEFISGINTGKPIADLDSETVKRSIWEESNAITERHNAPGEFTSFIGWEWTSTPQGNNLHRVVFTPDAADKSAQYIPYNAFDSDRPEDLWAWLEKTSARVQTDFIAIPHNANISGGLMFDDIDSKGRPLSTEYARTRMRWEPVIEATQIKGDSEAHPGLSPNDEFADFETYGHLLEASGSTGTAAPDAGDYARSALKRGLELEALLGANPYKFAMVGSTDSHTGAATAEEHNFAGKLALDSIPENKFKEVALGIKGSDMSASGLAAVWATENTREALFAAFRRKEVYATSGPRLMVRFFGGWDYQAADAKAANLAAVGYEKGVPMGGDLTRAPADKAPVFLIHAAKDPKGGNLDRIQVVKGWYKQGQVFERVYDAALSDGRSSGPDGRVPAVGNTVDVKTATYTNDIGDAQLATVWTDPDFDPAARAFYYVRVLQIPTPRHTLYDAVALGIPHPENIPASIQERAYTSPIWYTPDEDTLARAQAAALSVEGLKAKGVEPLDDAALKALLVGKTLAIRNLVSGEIMEASFMANGKRLLRNLNEDQRQASIWQAMHGGTDAEGVAAYHIRDGRIHTRFGKQNFEVAVYRIEDRIVAARTREQGFVNYEILASRYATQAE